MRSNCLLGAGFLFFEAMKVLHSGIGCAGGGGGLVAQLCLALTRPWLVAHQASLSTGFSRQEHWNVLPLPSPGDLFNPGIEPMSLVLQTDSLPLSY